MNSFFQASLDVSVFFQRGSEGRGVRVNVEPKEQPYSVTLCGTLYNSYKLCSNETFRDEFHFSNLYPYTDYNLTFSNTGAHESIVFRTDFGGMCDVHS